MEIAICLAIFVLLALLILIFIIPPLFGILFILFLITAFACLILFLIQLLF